MHRLRPRAVLATALLLALAACTPAAPEEQTAPSPTFAQLTAPVIIAHRGAGEQFPENTLYAMEHVAPYPRIVLDADVQLTDDGTLVLNHDPTLDRLSAPLSGPIGGYTEQTWKTVPVNWPARSTHQPQPPVHASTWKELADRWGGKRIMSLEGKTPAASRALIADIVARGIQLRVIFNSFSVEQCRQAADAGIPTAVIFARQPDLAAAQAAGAWGVVLYAPYATRKTIAAANARGLEVVVLQVSSRRQMELYLDRGAYGFATEDPFTLSGYPVPPEESLRH